MATSATLQCQACQADFVSQMPLTRGGQLGSSLMFLVEECPRCGDSSAYLRWQYRLDSMPARLSA